MVDDSKFVTIALFITTTTIGKKMVDGSKLVAIALFITTTTTTRKKM